MRFSLNWHKLCPFFLFVFLKRQNWCIWAEPLKFSVVFVSKSRPKNPPNCHKGRRKIRHGGILLLHTSFIPLWHKVGDCLSRMSAIIHWIGFTRARAGSFETEFSWNALQFRSDYLFCHTADPPCHARIRRQAAPDWFVWVATFNSMRSGDLYNGKIVHSSLRLSRVSTFLMVESPREKKNLSPEHAQRILLLRLWHVFRGGSVWIVSSFWGQDPEQMSLVFKLDRFGVFVMKVYSTWCCTGWSPDGGIEPEQLPSLTVTWTRTSTCRLPTPPCNRCLTCLILPAVEAFWKRAFEYQTFLSWQKCWNVVSSRYDRTLVIAGRGNKCGWVEWVHFNNTHLCASSVCLYCSRKTFWVWLNARELFGKGHRWTHTREEWTFDVLCFVITQRSICTKSHNYISVKL